MTAMDYRLTDAQADPPARPTLLHREAGAAAAGVLLLPPAGRRTAGFCRLPALERGYVTFGSFNKFAKVTPAVIAAWLNILPRVPDSRLVVLAYRGGFVENRLHVAAASKGIDPLRIELFDKQNHADYMRLIAEVDVALDPFPFNGHTTTCDAAWMGVPVVTLAGETYVTRFGSSVHVNVGLNDWIVAAWMSISRLPSRRRATRRHFPRCVAHYANGWPPRPCWTSRASLEAWRRLIARCGARDAPRGPMPSDANSSFQTALALHRAGDLRGAERAYRQVLVAEGQHAGAWHMLALIALASRRPELAEQLVLQALASDPHRAEYHATWAEACRGLGRVDDAIAGYRRAIDLRPNYAEAHANLGTLLHVQGDLPAAGACYRSAIDLAPDYAQAHHNLAIICQVLGDLDAAAAGFAEAARLNPRGLDSRLALGYLLAAASQAQEAHDFFVGRIARFSDQRRGAGRPRTHLPVPEPTRRGRTALAPSNRVGSRACPSSSGPGHRLAAAGPTYGGLGGARTSACNRSEFGRRPGAHGRRAP